MDEIGDQNFIRNWDIILHPKNINKFGIDRIHNIQQNFINRKQPKINMDKFGIERTGII
jgi:hypothetical protein